MLRGITSRLRLWKGNAGPGMIRMQSTLTPSPPKFHYNDSTDSSFNGQNGFGYLSGIIGALALTGLSCEDIGSFFFFGGSKRNRVEKRYAANQYQANNPIEDRYAVHNLSNADGFCATVFDGHGGWQCADWASKTLHGYIDQEIGRLGKKKGFTDEEVKNALTNAFTKVEEEFKEAALQAYKFNFAAISAIGSCCLCSLVIDNKLYTANLGDCRGVLFKKEKTTGQISFQKLNTRMSACSKKERERLRKEFPNEKDIVVMKKNNPDASYVKGRLQPTSAFGDFHLKYPEFNNPNGMSRKMDARFRSKIEPWNGPYISHIPEIKIFDLEKEHVSYVLASDGLWDEMKAKEVASMLERFKGKKNCNEITHFLTSEALRRAARRRGVSNDVLAKLPMGARRGYHDDITVVWIDLESQYSAN